MKNLKLPCKFNEFSATEDDSRLLKCSLRVQHDLDNVNGSYFDKDDIMTCAEKTLRNTPILGSVIYDEQSEEYKLNGHDVEYTIIQTEEGYDLKVAHIERIYGFIPSDAEIYTEFDEESGKTYLCTYGYLWKHYLDEVENILDNNNGQTDVSMEITVNESFTREDGLLQIKDYDFQGVTMLGVDVQPGMVGAELQLFSQNALANIKKDMEELYKVYNLEKEGKSLEDKKDFGLSVGNIEDQVKNQINAQLVETTDYWGDTWQHRAFWYRDLLTEEKIAIVEDYDSYTYYGVPYSLEGDTVTLDFENKKEYIAEWREKTGNDVTVGFSKEDEELKAHIINKFDSIETKEEELEQLQIEYNKLDAELKAMSDYAELKEFRDNYDKAKYEKEVEETLDMFGLEESETKELKEKALNKEFTIDEFKKELALIYSMKQLESKKNFAKEEEEEKEPQIEVFEKEEEYGSETERIIAKYSKK